MKKLKVDLEDLVIAFQDTSGLAEHYLDTQTGEIVMVSEDFPAEELGIDLEEEGRYIYIDNPYPYEGYEDMEDFIIFKVSDEKLARILGIAIKGKGAFRRFKDIVWEYPEVEAEWFKFRDMRWRERAIKWLAFHEIEPE